MILLKIFEASPDWSSFSIPNKIVFLNYIKRSKRDVTAYTDGRIEFDELYNGTYSYSRFRPVFN